ncbi:protein required for cell viability Rrp17 [Cordyceps militaris CM01]|uniref:Protein required for cell viability Rrp17 n=2 Tax=Cordyceps militaris TaxID=73501 RepID=G3JD68_CORMM|nr:protein required for cell viability Rrp17 [Cordyceps militaris CM01]ATY66505.1 required for cell viability Rrp17 [Cordyceps militaris]EGX92543.1 protein required for cell viability Rrp17 [Cordyceps militaris CM01]
MFAKPRAKKGLIPPRLSRKRKNTSEVEQVSFDNDAREEYLTGFHKRKVQRKKNAQEVATKRARQEKLDMRKQVRDERRQEMEDHVLRINEMLKASLAATEGNDVNAENEQGEEWDGFPDKPELDIVDHEEEYIDEDRYTTVTVETVSVSRDGLSKPELPSEDDESKKKEGDESGEPEESKEQKQNRKAPKPKKKQFRYESKTERDFENRKQRARNKAKRGI